MLGRLLMPVGAVETAFPLLATCTWRAFGDGYVAVLLPAYLLALGFDQLHVGFLNTATLAGSTLAMLGARYDWLQMDNSSAAAVRCLVNGNYRL
jgi:hypothetical protein